VDHLDGVLFIDHLSFWGRFMLWPRLIPFVVAEGWAKSARRKRGA